MSGWPQVSSSTGSSSSGNLVPVTNYGAVGNGVTNDSVAIQAAIAAAASSTNPGIVYFPPGKNFVAQGLTVPPGVILAGLNGQGYRDLVATVANPATLSQLSLPAGASSALLTPYDGGTNPSTNVQIRDLALNGNGQTPQLINMPDRAGLARFWLVDRCYLFNGAQSGSGGLAYIGVFNNAVKFRDCKIYNGTSGAAAGYAGLVWAGNDGIIDDCWIGFFSDYGLQMASGGSDICLMVRGGGIFGNGFAAILANAGLSIDEVSIDGNLHGIYMAASAQVSAHKCRFVNNTGDNFYVAGAGALLSTKGNRVAGTTATYHYFTNGNTLALSDQDTIIEPSTTFGTAYIDTPANITVPWQNARRGDVLATLKLAPTSQQTTNIASTVTAIPNLTSFSFVAPWTGQVKLRMKGYFRIAPTEVVTDESYIMGVFVTHSTTTAVTSYQRLIDMIAAVTVQEYIGGYQLYEDVYVGLTPGTTYTVDFAALYGGTGTPFQAIFLAGESATPVASDLGPAWLEAVVA